jgi:hypothetical protein
MSAKPYIPALRRAESYTNSNSSSPKTSPRILAAPFQLKEEQDIGSKTPPKISGIESGQYNFVPLEDYANVTFDKVYYTHHSSSSSSSLFILYYTILYYNIDCICYIYLIS